MEVTEAYLALRVGSSRTGAQTSNISSKSASEKNPMDPRGVAPLLRGISFTKVKEKIKNNGKGEEEWYTKTGKKTTLQNTYSAPRANPLEHKLLGSRFLALEPNPRGNPPGRRRCRLIPVKR